MVDHNPIACPHESTIAVMETTLEFLKTGQTDVRTDIKEMREDIGDISETTAEIKALVLNGGRGKENGFANNRLLTWVILGLTAVLMGVLGVSIPF